MQLKRRKNSTSLRYNTNDIVLKDRELDKHRRIFLGNPGSTLWRDFHYSLNDTKHRMFQNRNTKLQSGGVLENKLADALFAIVSAVFENKTGKQMTQQTVQEGEEKEKEEGEDGEEDDVKFDATNKKRKCGVTMGWLVDLFEMDEMPDLLKFAQKQVKNGFITLPNEWENIDVTSLIEENKLKDSILKNGL